VRDDGELEEHDDLVEVCSSASTGNELEEAAPEDPVPRVAAVGIKVLKMQNLIPHLVMTIEENIYQQIYSGRIKITCTRNTTELFGL